LFFKGSEIKKLSELYYFKDSEGAPKIVSDTDPLPIGDVNVGDKTDAAVTDPTLTASEIALLKGLVKILSDVWDDTSNTTKVTLQQVEGAIDSAVPTKAAFVGGKYSSADPSYHDGDLTPVRTNAKGEVLTQLMGSRTGKGILSSFTRANATDAYIAGDVIADSASAATVQSFAGVGAAGDEIMILGVTALFKKVSTNLALPTGMTTFTLHLYNAAPAAINDNVAWSLPYADADKYLGSIQTAVMADKGDILWSENSGINKPIVLAGTSLYYIPVTDAGFTPTAQVVKNFTLHSLAL